MRAKLRVSIQGIHDPTPMLLKMSEAALTGVKGYFPYKRKAHRSTVEYQFAKAP